MNKQTLTKSKMLITAILLSILPALAFTQESVMKLTDRVSITFPGKPSERDFRGVTTLYSLRLADSTANFSVVVTDVEKASGFDAIAIEAASEQPEFWSQAENAFIANLGPGVKLISKDMKEIDGRKVMQLNLEGIRDNKLNTLVAYIFTEGIYSFNVVHTNRNGKADTTLRDSFFTSLKIMSN